MEYPKKYYKDELISVWERTKYVVKNQEEDDDFLSNLNSDIYANYKYETHVELMLDTCEHTDDMHMIVFNEDDEEIWNSDDN